VITCEAVRFSDLGMFREDVAAPPSLVREDGRHNAKIRQIRVG